MKIEWVDMNDIEIDRSKKQKGMYKCQVKKDFQDVEANMIRQTGSIFYSDDEQRVRDLCNKRLVVIKAIKKPRVITNKKSIIIYQSYLFVVGGIETLLQHMAKEFPNHNILFLFGNANHNQLIELGRHWDCEQFNMGEYECDIFIGMNYNTPDILFQLVKANIYYNYYAHACWLDFMKIAPDYKNAVRLHREDVRPVAVSTVAKNQLKAAFDIKAKVVPNILSHYHDPVKFITLSRLSDEKGGDIILKLLEEFNKSGYDFIWIIGCTVEDYNKDLISKLKSYHQVIFLEPSLSNQHLIGMCDYSIQPAKTESFCYGAYESLQRGVPVIMLEHPQSKKIIKDGENGYLLTQNLSNLDVEKIFNKIPTGLNEVMPPKTQMKKMIEGKL